MTFSLTSVKNAIASGFQRRQHRYQELQTKYEALKSSQSAQRVGDLESQLAAEKQAKRDAHRARQRAEDRATAAEAALMELKGLADADILAPEEDPMPATGVDEAGDTPPTVAVVDHQDPAPASGAADNLQPWPQPEPESVGAVDSPQ